MFNMVVFHT